MKVPGIKTAKRLSRWAKARFLGGAIILGYHRISAALDDVYEVCVSPENFSHQMEILCKYARPISLLHLVQYLKRGAVPPKSVVVTFDDGYVDNLHIAKPILEKYGIPATVFVCTGYAGKELWWDELAHLVKSSRADPRALRIQPGGFEWNGTQAISTVENHKVQGQLRDVLYQSLLLLDVEDQNLAMDSIRKWAGSFSHETGESRTMTEGELLQLADGGLIEIGAHTRYHPTLPQLSFERQKEEIESSKKDLESLLGKQIMGFAYPNGRATGSAKRIVQDIGFAYACTSLNDVVRPGNDLYELTRFWQKDVDGDKFMKGLRVWSPSIQ